MIEQRVKSIAEIGNIDKQQKKKELLGCQLTKLYVPFSATIKRLVHV